jgi:hypothetical protein
MRAVAIKKSSREKAVGFQEMGNLRCDGCGEEFFIGHSPGSVDKWVAEKQAKWLEKVLAEEHERDKKHPTESNCLTNSRACSYRAEGSTWFASPLLDSENR